MRPQDADGLLLQYLAAREQRYAIRSPALSITGATSGCCNTQTFERFSRLYCWRCRKPCVERAWQAPRSGTASGGGWTAEVDRFGNSTSKLRVCETHVTKGDTEDDKRAANWERFEQLEQLFAMPAGWTLSLWENCLATWEAFLHPTRGGLYGTAQSRGVSAETIRELVRQGRQVVGNRLHNPRREGGQPGAANHQFGANRGWVTSGEAIAALRAIGDV